MSETQKINPWNELMAKRPEYCETINEHIAKMRELSTLDDKAFNLLWIGIQAALDYDLAVQAHVSLALEAGATKDEVLGAAAIGCAAAGPKGFVKCSQLIFGEFERLGV